MKTEPVNPIKYFILNLNFVAAVQQACIFDVAI